MTFLEDTQVLKKIIDNLFSKVSKKTDLNVNEIRVLLFLYQNKDLDIASSIVKNLMISKSHVSSSVEILNNKNYINKIQDSKDRKKFHLKLTKKSDKIIEVLKNEQNKLKNSLFQGISEDDKSKFIETFNKVLENARILKIKED